MEMMKKIKYLMGAIMLGALVFAGCDNDDDGSAPELTVQAITATGTSLETGDEISKDLNAAASATDVPTDAVFEITFNREVDASTATASNITLTSDEGAVTTNMSANGSVVTVTPAQELIQGTDYTLTITSGIAGNDGGTFTSTTRTFTTAGRAPAVIPEEESLALHVSFDGEVTESMGHSVLNDEVTFAEDRFGNFESAGSFNGTTNYVGIEYASDLTSPSQTISYWMKLPESDEYNTHVRTDSYVTYSLGGDKGTFHEWGRFDCCDPDPRARDFMKYVTAHINTGSEGGIITRFNENKQEGNDPNGDLTFELDNLDWLEENTGEWLHVVTTYDADQSKKTFYFNGVKGTEFVFPTTPESATGPLTLVTEDIDSNPGNNKNLYIGSGLPYWAVVSGDGIEPKRGENAFAYKGLIDDFRIFSVALTDAEVMELYNAERP